MTDRKLPPDALAELQEWFTPTSPARWGEALTDTFPASSRLNRELRESLVNLQGGPNCPQKLSRRISAVLDGKEGLGSLFEEGGLTLPKFENLPKDMRDAIKAIQEGDFL